MLRDNSDDSGMTWVGRDRENRGGFGHDHDKPGESIWTQGKDMLLVVL